MSSTTPSPTPSPSYPSRGDMSSRYATFGIISAIVSLFIVPEIFGSAAIILGAYAWKKDTRGSNLGLFVIVLGIICMLLGIYFLALFALIDLVPA